MIKLGSAQLAFGIAEKVFNTGGPEAKIAGGLALIAAGGLLALATSGANRANRNALSAGGGAAGIGSYSAPSYTPVSVGTAANNIIDRSVNINIVGRLEAEGSKLVAVIQAEQFKNVRVTGRRQLV